MLINMINTEHTAQTHTENAEVVMIYCGCAEPESDGGVGHLIIEVSCMASSVMVLSRQALLSMLLLLWQ